MKGERPKYNDSGVVWNLGILNPTFYRINRTGRVLVMKHKGETRNGKLGQTVYVHELVVWLTLISMTIYLRGRISRVRKEEQKT